MIIRVLDSGIQFLIQLLGILYDFQMRRATHTADGQHPAPVGELSYFSHPGWCRICPFTVPLLEIHI